ncbi:glycosyltransferase family 9 protein [Nocardioides sp. Kera G14]|uniref:glycosyltransferase family 9 protein n=1 Tax=Nocardioides sp. Kera G14 TaxID=2884264 RepID=UPI001D10E7D6|nr:glycosyltransferase family 9 protein [Nocardioides sp. Kera G14]UDY24980.1 glycosyltransferase family 9 protein [Nocardioides sp. Kera G14]
MRTLAVRLDSMGDVLLAGPALRALAATSDHVTLLCGPLGRTAAALLPGVDDVLCWSAPWVLADPPPVDPSSVEGLRATIADGGYDRAVIFTSFHQSPLPTALVLRLAGVSWIGAISVDYPGSLLDLRHRIDDDLPEPERALSLATACGGALPAGDDGRLAVRPERIRPPESLPRPYVVLHPGTSAPARAWPAGHFRAACSGLVEAGFGVVVTGGRSEQELTAYVAGEEGRDLGGLLDLEELAGVLDRAEAVVVGNTGPAHLTAAVGTPVVSLYSPTVPAVRWAPYGVDRVLLGDQAAPCRDTRALTCPVPGHPCLSSVQPRDVIDAVVHLCGLPDRLITLSTRSAS